MRFLILAGLVVAISVIDAPVSSAVDSATNAFSEATDISTKIDVSEAYLLIELAFTRNEIGGGLMADTDKPEHGFYIVDEVTTFPGADGSVNYFAVNAWTGDVWSVWFCPQKHRKNPALKVKQAEIRRRFSPAELKSYRELSRIRPGCMFP